MAADIMEEALVAGDLAAAAEGILAVAAAETLAAAAHREIGKMQRYSGISIGGVQ